MLVSTPKVILASPDLVFHTSTIQHTLCRLSNALEEVQSGVRIFNDLKPTSTIPESFIERIGKRYISTKFLKERVDGALQNMRLTSVPVLLDGKLTFCVCARIKSDFQFVKKMKIKSSLKRLNIYCKQLQYYDCGQKNNPNCAILFDPLSNGLPHNQSLMRYRWFLKLLLPRMLSTSS